jgi:hypothetical protein
MQTAQEEHLQDVLLEGGLPNVEDECLVGAVEEILVVGVAVGKRPRQ